MSRRPLDALFRRSIRYWAQPLRAGSNWRVRPFEVRIAHEGGLVLRLVRYSHGMVWTVSVLIGDMSRDEAALRIRQARREIRHPKLDSISLRNSAHQEHERALIEERMYRGISELG